MNIQKTLISKKTGNEIRYECFECSLVHNVPLYINDEMVARAFLLEPADTDWYILFDIQIYDDEKRGMGYGSEVMNYVKTKFGRIQTGARNERVANFLTKNGFKVKKSRLKGKQDIYFFLRGMEDDLDAESTEPNG